MIIYDFNSYKSMWWYIDDNLLFPVYWHLSLHIELPTAGPRIGPALKELNIYTTPPVYPGLLVQQENKY